MIRKEENMTRKEVLTAIKAEVAEHGYRTEKAILLFVRNRVGRDSYNAALMEGRRIFEAGKQ